MRPVVATLAAHTLGAAPVWQALPAREVDCASGWVLIHAWSDPGPVGPGVIPTRAPFHLQIRPSGGEERWMPLLLTVPMAARVCVRASLIELAAANLGPAANRIVVSCNPLDGPTATANVFEEWLIPSEPDDTIIVHPPPWALDARVDLAVEDRAGAFITLRQTDSPTEIHLKYADQLAGTFPLGGITSLRVGPISYAARVVYRLAM